jgi:L-galactono-1,4-lactone dehydrogenase
MTDSLLLLDEMQQVELIVAAAHAAGQRIRVVGNALSPNGIGLSSDTMLTLALCDKIIAVDPLNKTVRVQAGARVQQVVDALQPYG